MGLRRQPVPAGYRWMIGQAANTHHTLAMGRPPQRVGASSPVRSAATSAANWVRLWRPSFR
jgi:hypothetical protein